MAPQKSRNLSTWEKSRLEGLFVVCNDKTKQLKTSEYGVTGFYPIIDQSVRFICGYTDDPSKVYEGDLPVVVFGDHTRYVKFVDFRFVTGADGTQLLRQRRKIDIKYLYYLVTYASGRMGSYGYDRHLKHLKEFVFVFPRSEIEQSKIAEILTTVDEAIDNTGALIQKYERIKQGVMQDLLTKGIDENGNIRDEKTHKFKDSPLGRIPEEWETKEFDQVCIINPEKITNVKPSSLIKYIDIDSIRSFHVTRAKVYKYKDAPSRAQRIVREEDIIVSTVRPYLKAFAYITKEFDKCVCSTGFAVVRIIDRGEYDNRYIYQFILNENLFLKQVLPLMTGSNYPAIKSSDINKMQICIPKKLEEQRIVASILSEVDKKIEAESGHKQKLLAIKRGLMEDLLTGTVRVDHLIENN